MIWTRCGVWHVTKQLYLCHDLSSSRGNRMTFKPTTPPAFVNVAMAKVMCHASHGTKTRIKKNDDYHDDNLNHGNFWPFQSQAVGLQSQPC